MASQTLNANTLNSNTANIHTLNQRAVPIPNLHGLTYSTVATASAISLAANTISGVNYTGAAACVATLPAAEPGVVCVYLQQIDTQGGTATLTFDCAGSDSFETGSLVPTTAGNLILYDVSTDGETSIVHTPISGAATSFFGYGSLVEFSCSNAGKWHVNVNYKQDIGVTDDVAAGTMLFAA